MTQWTPGMKAVCIYHFRRERAAWPTIRFPTFGTIYTVIDVVSEPTGTWLLFAEIENPICWHGGWWAKRYRPAVDNKASSILEVTV